jgi:glycosyltransferase involved in cell wall biosynthesis
VKILALTRYDTLSASTRQRFVQYEPYLADAGFSLEYSSLLDNDYLQRMVEGRPASRTAVARGYLGRLRRLVGRSDYDALWVHSELFPFFPGWAELIGAALAGRPMVLDYDDAVFHVYDAAPRPLIRRLLGRKLVPLMRRAAACTCGNPYLQAYAAQYSPLSIVVPTVVDTEEYRPLGRPQEDRALTIGWIGSPSTWRFVQPILPVLREVAAERGVRIKAVGAGAGALPDRFDGLDLVDWEESREIAEVQAMDIGIMPVPDEIWHRGKSGYKLIQYMACGLPVVASPVGVNSDIVDEGVNGFLAADADQWKRALMQLTDHAALRSTMGAAGRGRAEELYSLHAHGPRIAELFRSVVSRRR